MHKTINAHSISYLQHLQVNNKTSTNGICLFRKHSLQTKILDFCSYIDKIAQDPCSILWLLFSHEKQKTKAIKMKNTVTDGLEHWADVMNVITLQSRSTFVVIKQFFLFAILSYSRRKFFVFILSCHFHFISLFFFCYRFFIFVLYNYNYIIFHSIGWWEMNDFHSIINFPT